MNSDINNTLEYKVLTVTELTKLIKGHLENSPEFNNIWIKGEISNITYHSSGHIYFTLKDEKAVLSVVFFRFANKKLKFKLEEGMSIFALGSVTLFEPRGSYQFNVVQVKLEGIGELQKQIEQLKKKLTAEGIFAPEHKKKIPYLPRRVGVVTSPTGAALRDIIKVALRRFPNIEIVIAPAKVQGADAATTITRGIVELNRAEHNIDVIIAGRGGGSFEDLMPFNEEIVIRAFFESRVPIISAVGHQIDHPLSDDAADLTAPTPSAAAELAVPVKYELEEYIQHLKARSYTSLLSLFRELKLRINGIMRLRIFKNPLEIVYNQELLLGDLNNRIISALKDNITSKRNQLLKIPNLTMVMGSLIKDKVHRYTVAIQNLDNLSPLGILKRGYAVASNQDGSVIKSISEIEEGDTLNLRLSDGSLKCSVNTKDGEIHGGKEKEI